MGPNMFLEPLCGVFLSAEHLIRHKGGLGQLQGRPRNLGLFEAGVTLIKAKSLMSQCPYNLIAVIALS